MINLIQYTKQFGLESDYNRRLMKDKYSRRLARLHERKEDRIARAEDRDALGGLFHKARARRHYRKADKLQRNINRIERRIEVAGSKGNRFVEDDN